MGSNFLPPAKRSMAAPNPYSSNGSFKRSKQPPPPLSIPLGHVAFRLLCHPSRIGGVIGKSGTVIRNLQQVTGAKIRVEDALSESPDRVILVIAPSALSGRVFLRNTHQNFGEQNGDCGGGGDNEGVEVSKAQEACLRVFERILEVAAENGGREVGDGLVSCRLLADTGQVGSVIGKGGKVVEKIRKDTGCKVRILTDNLPACTVSSDEIIEIEGNVSAVKRALVAVCRRLQDCPPADRTKMMGNKSIEAVQHETLVSVPHETLNAVQRETLPDLQVDHLLHRSSVVSTTPSSSNSFATGARSLSAEVNGVSTLDPKSFQREVTFRLLCSNDRVGGVIGKGGSIVRALQNETGATISIGPSVADCEDRLVTVTASEDPESVYSPAQKCVVLVFSRSVEAGFERGQDSGSNKGSGVTARLVVPTNQVGCLLGKGGAIVSEMRKATGTSIKIIGNDQVPKCAADNDQMVQISGEFSNVQDALYNATGRVRDNLFASTQNSTGTRSISSVLADTSPYGRLRDPVPTGSQPVVGSSHSLSRHTLTHGMDHLGLSQNLDHPPSPGLWTSKTVAGINSRGINDVGRGLTYLKGGLELGSGSKTAILTNTTLEIIVPNYVIGSVYGENGSNLVRLRQISGAKVIIHEPRPGTTDRTIVISGTPDETQAAQSLLQAFILTGSS
ncbi:hypothetical protein L6164_032654 [Bauhinia variegata]|uniref:Uncharacterized protein n=1 Tax=Bauhinia variegata TaxID=167791 RepID=A0ACB9KPC2_BAUVA|nr:hypothetical protein L6164_032654 [Bauhinia variegata]